MDYDEQDCTRLQRTTSGLASSSSMPVITSTRLAAASMSNSSHMTVSRQVSQELQTLADMQSIAKDTGSSAEVQQSLMEMLMGRHVNNTLVSLGEVLSHHM